MNRHPTAAPRRPVYAGPYSREIGEADFEARTPRAAWRELMRRARYRRLARGTTTEARQPLCVAEVGDAFEVRHWWDGEIVSPYTPAEIAELEAL